MRPVLLYKNFPTEGPGILADVMDRRGVPYTVAERGRGQPLDPRGFGAVVVLGGPQSANDRDAPTRQALRAIRRVARAGTPFLGICLGAQMLARALGAPVARAPAPEYGGGVVRLTSAGRRDPLFRGVPARLPVLQWHGETFGVPPRGVLLAKGTACPRQAFRVGRAWGVQFHNEATPPMVERWAGAGAAELRRAGVEPGRMVAAYRRRARAIGRCGERMAANFLKAAGLL
ncbi:MAG: type 1 glutamine amidotransferase [Halobacteria archaeon]